MKTKTQKHTPGPWGVLQTKTGPAIVAGCWEVVVYAQDGIGGDVEANAKLIAAAPELLDAALAAERYLALLEPSSTGDRAYRMLTAAIAKAEGR